MTRPRIYLSILALIALYSLMGNMDRAWLEAEAQARPWSVSTIRMEADTFGPWSRFVRLPIAEAECQ